MPERVEKPPRNLRQEQTPLSTKQARTPRNRGVLEIRQLPRLRAQSKGGGGYPDARTGLAT